jgi:deoxyribodipyrimidine photo-lyase
MSDSLAIHWFRQDLRLSDNPSLTAASVHNRVLPIYILDDSNTGEYAMGAASGWWLHHSLVSLNTSLNSSLSIYRGNPIEILVDIITRSIGIAAMNLGLCIVMQRSRPICRPVP